jgi:HK97 gp10 family phage protein
MDVGIEIVGLDALGRKLKAMPEAVCGQNLELALRSGALLIEGPAKDNAPKKTGNLARSIHTETQVTSNGGEAKIGTDGIYAGIQEFGGTVEAKNVRALHFQIDGVDVFTWKVEIPAHPYLRPAFDENKERAVREVGDSLGALIKRAAT